MHAMFGGIFTFNRGEGAGAHMKRQVESFDPPPVKGLEKFPRKVQPCGRGGDRAFHPGIDGLVSFGIGGHRLPFEVGWDGRFSRGFQDLTKGEIAGRPAEPDGEGIAGPPGLLRLELNRDPSAVKTHA